MAAGGDRIGPAAWGGKPHPSRINRRYTKPAKKLTKLTVPQQAVPHVKFLFAEMHRQRLTYEDVEWRSGILKNTLKAWRHKNQPNLANIEACLGAVGWTLMPVPAQSALPADIVAELRPVADRLGLTMPTTVELLIEILARGARFAGVADTEPETNVVSLPAPADHPEMLRAA